MNSFKVALAGLLGMTLASATVLLAQPADALDSSSIRLSALSVNESTPIRVEIPYLYTARVCTLALSGPKNSRAYTVPVRNSTAKAAVPTKGLPTGSYVVRANCGKDGKATSSSFSIVPKGAPTTATCDVTDRGFSQGADGATTYGAQITNRSPGLTATSVKLAVAFLDGAGNTLATRTQYVMDIAPGESVLAGGYESVTAVASVRVDSVCEATTTAPTPRLRGQAQTIAPRSSSYFPTQFGGTIPNPFTFIISASSSMDYVTRNAAGAITGGGSAEPEAFIPVGATGTWNDIGVMYPENVASVDWVMDTRMQ
jgi:hypothetical protein